MIKNMYTATYTHMVIQVKQALYYRVGVEFNAPPDTI